MGNFFFISAFFGDTPPLPQEQTPEYGQRSAGTHPTGMHSCSFVIGLASLANMYSCGYCEGLLKFFENS